MISAPFSETDGTADEGDDVGSISMLGRSMSQRSDWGRGLCMTVVAEETTLLSHASISGHFRNHRLPEAIQNQTHRVNKRFLERTLLRESAVAGVSALLYRDLRMQ